MVAAAAGGVAVGDWGCDCVYVVVDSGTLFVSFPLKPRMDTNEHQWSCLELADRLSAPHVVTREQVSSLM